MSSDPWLDERLDGVPRRLAMSLRESVGDLEGAALAALRAAEQMSSDRRSSTDARAGAEPLLLADALITYACENALERGDPERVWSKLIERIGIEPR